MYFWEEVFDGKMLEILLKKWNHAWFFYHAHSSHSMKCLIITKWWLVNIPSHIFVKRNDCFKHHDRDRGKTQQSSAKIRNIIWGHCLYLWFELWKQVLPLGFSSGNHRNRKSREIFSLNTQTWVHTVEVNAINIMHLAPFFYILDKIFRHTKGRTTRLWGKTGQDKCCVVCEGMGRKSEDIALPGAKQWQYHKYVVFQTIEIGARVDVLPSLPHLQRGLGYLLLGRSTTIRIHVISNLFSCINGRCIHLKLAAESKKLSNRKTNS